MKSVESLLVFWSSGGTFMTRCSSSKDVNAFAAKIALDEDGRAGFTQKGAEFVIVEENSRNIAEQRVQFG